MTNAEFDEVAADTALRLTAVDVDERIAAACRGSGNPAALAWLAEGCGIGPQSRVVDLGSGLGGPAAWILRHYRCRSVVALEPAAGAAFGSARLFDVPVVQGDAASAPLRSGGFDVALLLGVLSVAEDPFSVAREAFRLANRVGVLEYCSTRGRALMAGGSRFPTVDGLVHCLERAGLTIVTTEEQLMASPPSWIEASAANETADERATASDSEREVGNAIEARALTPWLFLANHG